VRTVEYLTDPSLAPLFWPAVVVGLEVALLGAALSVFVVLKRMSFVGQGISHAAFGGVGLAAALGLAAAPGQPGLAQLAIVVGFCLLSAGAISVLSEARGVRADAAIGIVLVASMALGAVLLHAAQRAGRQTLPSWEGVLFGNLLVVRWADALLGAVVLAGVLASLWTARRRLLFWAFDEQAAPAFAVGRRAPMVLLTILLTFTIISAMKLAGVLLATALLVLPGAAALQLSARLARVFLLAGVLAILGMVAGMVIAFETDWPAGPTVVLVLSGCFLGARGARLLRSRRTPGRAAPA
jgi:zinc transport system permease protein